MRFPAVFAAATVAALAFAAPARADLLVKIDKSTQQMTVSADGEQLYVWPVSTGIAKYDTPNGAYTPFRKEKDHFSREWDDAPMPYSIFFTMKGHAIHGTNHKGLGHPASHGCVRLSVANAAKLWDLVAKHKMKNTTIILTGKIPEEEAPAVARNSRGGERSVASVQRQADAQQYADEDDDDQGALPQRRIYREPRYYYDDRPYYRSYDRPRGLFFFPFGR